MKRARFVLDEGAWALLDAGLLGSSRRSDARSRSRVGAVPSDPRARTRRSRAGDARASRTGQPHTPLTSDLPGLPGLSAPRGGSRGPETTRPGCGRLPFTVRLFCLSTGSTQRTEESPMSMPGQLKLGRLALLGTTLGWLCGGVSTAVTAQTRSDFEKPPTLAARDLVPAERLQGPGYRIDETVPTDGLLATFTVRSDYGVFTARGPGMLGIRLGEVAGLRQLEWKGQVARKGSAISQADQSAAEPSPRSDDPSSCRPCRPSRCVGRVPHAQDGV